MDKKKDPSRFGIKLNKNDPAHKVVIEVLNGQSSRGKAQFIVNAILHYIHCPETPDMMQQIPPDRESIEAIVLKILNKQNTTTAPSSTIQSSNHSKSMDSATPLPALENNKSGTEKSLNAASMASISDTLAAFRRT